jgi:hypothetical protein
MQTFFGPSDRRALALAAALLAGAACCGCSSGKDYVEVPFFPVCGELTVNGQPGAGAFIRFHPVTPVGLSKGNKPFARAGADGRFAVTTYDTGDGAPAGEYRVTIIWPEDPEARGPSPDRLNGRDAAPEKSELRVTIKEAENTLERWELK